MNSSRIDKRDLRKFGVLLAIILSVIGSIYFFKSRQNIFLWFISFAAVSFVTAIFLPILLKPVYVLFKSVGGVIGKINTVLLLSLIYYLLITPVGLIMRLFGNEPLHKKIEKEKQSYWVKRDILQEDIAGYEKQF